MPCRNDVRVAFVFVFGSAIDDMVSDYFTVRGSTTKIAVIDSNAMFTGESSNLSHQRDGESHNRMGPVQSVSRTNCFAHTKCTHLATPPF